MRQYPVTRAGNKLLIALAEKRQLQVADFARAGAAAI